MKKSMIHFALCFVMSLLITGNAFSANEYFRSIASGNWNATSTWQMSTNSGSTWIAATITPTDASGEITVRYPNTVTVTVNVNADQLTIDSGSISINSGIILTLLNGAGTDFTVLKGGSVTGLGTFQTQGAVVMNIRGGSNFNSAMKVNTGTATVSELSSPYEGKLFGNVTVDAGATLSSNVSSAYTLLIYGNITNNGTITGAGSYLKFYGSALTNTSSISTPNFSFDSNSTVTGAGTWTGGTITISANGNVSLLNNLTFSLTGSFTIYTGGDFTANGNILTFTSGTFNILTGGTVANSGTIKTQNSIIINPRTGSAFNANLNVNTGTTMVAETSSPYDGKLFGNVTVDAGATLSSNVSSAYTLLIFGNIINNGAITGAGSFLKFYGSSLTNTGSISTPNFSFDSNSTVTGAGTWTGGNITISANGNVSLLNNVTFSISGSFNINTGGDFTANGNILTFTSGTFNILTGGTVANSGTIKTQNSVTINPRTGSAFNANLNVNTGTTFVAETSTPYNGRLNGNVTVDAGAILSSGTSSAYTLLIYGNITNNGSITGAGSSLKFYGSSLINTGSISTPNFSFDSNSTVTGAGTWTGGTITISANGNVSLLSNVIFSLTGSFTINTGGDFTANGNTFTFTSGTFNILTGGTVANSGTIKTQNSVTIIPRTGSAFNANLNVNSGTTFVAETSSPYNARLYGNVTVDAGAILSSGTSGAYTLLIFGNIINNGIITGSGDIDFQSGAHSLLGTGSITADLYLLSGAAVTLGSNHQMKNVTINAGSTFIISNYLLKFTASNPITQNGTFTTSNSKVEYNGTSLQNVSVANIVYGGLRINNSAGASFLGNVTVNDTLSVIFGDLNLSGSIITLASTGYLTETTGNTIFGTSGYITYTRNIGTPSALNVGGLGAVLTATSNLGNTEVKRGHTVQTGLNGGTSIKRYYDITPANNTGLTASLVFKYDDSELNGKPESLLKLFKSTNTGTTWSYQVGTVNTISNQITLSGITSFSRWSSDSSAASASIKMIMEGFYDPSANTMSMDDTARAYLRNTSFPYAIVDSAKSVINSSTFGAGFQFANATSGTYYLQMKHRNSIETWSNAGLIYSVGTTLNYDFTFGANMAFGNNQIKVDNSPLRFAFYSGDINQDGTIDAADLSQVENDAGESLTGYVNTDVNGDDFVDAGDVSIVENNVALGVSAITP